MAEMNNNNLERLFLWGRPFSPLYSALMKLRAGIYRKGLLKRQGFEVPVISVGNLVLGGTGKTPLVLYIADLIQQQGKKPAILSRGYKGSAADPVNIVSTTSEILLDAGKAGDEPRFLAEKLPGVPVLTGKKRRLTGRIAIDDFKADVLILDDGFQHLAVHRDLDLVLFSAEKLLGNGRVLPGGELREPLSALKRASAFIMTSSCGPASSKADELSSFLNRQFPGIPVFAASYKPNKFLFKIHGKKTSTVSQREAASMPLFGFCGIAGPESFRKTLLESNIQLKGFRTFADHHAYSEADISSLVQAARNSGAAGLITTEKDQVKLRRIMPDETLLFIQPVELVPADDFNRFLLDRLDRLFVSAS